MAMISYAQNHDDALLRRAVPNANDSFYFDVGANEPNADSVTKRLYEQGWRNINIEPGKGLYERLCAVRKNDINLNIRLSNCNDDVCNQLGVYKDLGPDAIEVARRLHRMAARIPRFSSAVKRIVRIGA